MRIAALLVLFATALMFAAGCGKKSESSTGPASPDVGKPGPTTTLSDKDRFQGVWKGESFDDGTTRKEAKGDRVPRLQVEGDRVSLRETATDPGEPFTATWDSAKNPKTLTLVPSGPGGMPAPDATQVDLQVRRRHSGCCVQHRQRITANRIQGTPSGGDDSRCRADPLQEDR